MTGFLPKKLKNIQTLGEKLTKHRQNKGLSQEKAARLINLNVRYIRNIEKDNYDQLPADVYAHNIYKKYAELLDLNPMTVVDQFEKEQKLFFKTRSSIKKRKTTLTGKIMNILLSPKTLKYGLTTIVLIALFLYLGWGINKIISPPELTIESPEDNLITSQSQIIIQGQTEKEVNLAVNNRPLLSDKNGSFSLTLDLQNGLNIIKISAQKKHSKENVVYRRVIVTDDE